MTLVKYEDFVEFFGGEHPAKNNRSIDWAEYCAKEQSAPNCGDCCYVNYGRDCHNNPANPS